MKKILFALLSLALFALAAAACSSGGAASETDAGTADKPSSESTAETAAETGAPHPDPYADLPATPAALDALIGSISGATIENVTAVDRAYLAYWQLSETDRAAVTKYGDLQTLRVDLLKQYVVKEYEDTRIPHEKLLLGAFVFYRYDDEHIRQLADADIDFIWLLSTINEYSMAQFEKFGIGVIAEPNQIGLPSWRGEFSGSRMLEPDNPVIEESLRASIDPEAVMNYPAIWGVNLEDEPAVGEFSSLEILGRVYRDYLPGTAIFCNLFPNYATAEQLGAMNYQMYVNSYQKTVKSDMICFDHYYENVDLVDTLKNMRIVSEAAAESGRDPWTVLQIGRSDPSFPAITPEMLRFQAYLSMAYGTKMIMWFCWDNAVWYGNVMDSNGIPTVSYDYVKTVDAELKALEPIYMRYSGSSAALLLGANADVVNKVGTSFDKSKNNNLKRYVKDYGFDKLAQTALSDLTGSDDNFVIVGCLTENVGEGEAFLLIDATDKLYSDPDRKPAVVTFRTVRSDAVVIAYVRGIPTRLTPDADGVYTVEIHGSDAVFVTVD